MDNSTIPIHDVQIIHDWVDTHRTLTRDGSATSFGECQHCGATRRVFHLKPRPDPTLNDLPRPEAVAVLRDLMDTISKGSEAIQESFNDLFRETGYGNMDDLEVDFAKRSQGIVRAGEFSLHLLEDWATAPKHIEPRILLAYKQGPVCNRCDRLYPMDQLEVDHINPDRTRAQLTNLQLLCGGCHGRKGNNAPGDRDVSPFSYEGESCVHRVTCTEANPPLVRHCRKVAT